MSAVDFVLEGPSGDSFETVDFGRKEEAQVSLLESGPSYSDSRKEVSKALNERIVEIIREDRSQFIIDNAVNVIDVSKQTRQSRIEFWESRRFEMYCVGATGLAGTMGSAALAMFGAPIIGVASLAVSIFVSVMGFKRAGQASEQINQWQIDLPTAIAAERKEVFDRGFLVALSNGVPKPYTVVLNQLELLGLHYEYFCQFVSRLREAVTHQDRVRLIEASISKGPLSPEALKVAQFSAQHFQYLSAYLNAYNQVVGDIQRIMGAAREQQAAMRREIEGRIAQIEKEKKEALQPCQERFNLQKERLDRQRLEALRNQPQEGDIAAYRKFIEQEYKDALRLLEINFNQEKNTISRPFDEQIRRERELLEIYSKNIDNFKAEQLLPYFNPIAQVQIDTLAEYQRLFVQAY